MTDESLTVAVAQAEIVVGDLAANIATHLEVIRAARARLIVFPELSLTGYDLDAPSVAPTDAVLRPLIDACRASSAVALAGAPITESGRDFIAMLRIDEHGVSVAARKVWVHGGENGRFSCGTEAAVIDVDGWAVGLAICFDTNVQQHTAQLARRGVDLYAAGVLDGPGEQGERLARTYVTARALRAPVAIAHYRGSTPLFPVTVGTSMIVDADGEMLAQVDDAGMPYASACLRKAD